MSGIKATEPTVASGGTSILLFWRNAGDLGPRAIPIYCPDDHLTYPIW